MKKYQFDPKPTEFLGRRYRSRLEARWAAMFTMMGIRFEYEPIDLLGWMPDFQIYSVASAFIEVKPHAMVDEWVLKKMRRAAGNHNLIILYEKVVDDSGTIGLEVNRPKEPEWYNVGGWDLHIKHPFDFASKPGGHNGLIFPGNPYSRFLEADEVTEMWNEAGNKVMYLDPIKNN